MPNSLSNPVNNKAIKHPTSCDALVVERLCYCADATCVGCGCTDSNACVDEFHETCHWLKVNRKTRLGVCSFCIPFLSHPLTHDIASQSCNGANPSEPEIAPEVSSGQCLRGASDVAE